MERATNRALLHQMARVIPTRDRLGRKTITLSATHKDAYGESSHTTQIHIDREAAESLMRQLGGIL